jgi:PKD repeat protein
MMKNHILRLILIFVCFLAHTKLLHAQELSYQSVDQDSIHDPIDISNLKKNFQTFNILKTSSPSGLVGMLRNNILQINLPSLASLKFSLTEYNIFSAQYKSPSNYDASRLDFGPNDVKTYKAYINGNADFSSRITYLNGNIYGYFNMLNEAYFIEPLSKFCPSFSDDYILIYKASDILEIEKGQCTTQSLFDETHQHIPHREKAEENIQAVTCSEAQIAIAADFGYINKYGGTSAAEAQIINVLNLVNGLYNIPELGVEYKLAGTFLVSTSGGDPWNSTTDADDLLTSFTSWGNNGGFGFTFDVASLWTSRNLVANGSNGIVGIAWIGGVCTNNRYNVLEDYSTNIRALMINQSHELGHNWNAQHANGSSFIMNPTIGSTNDDWDATTINSILNFKNNRKCLSACPPKAPIANLNADNTYTCSGLVSFKDASLNNPTSWLWNFGDGNSSISQSPVHRYQKSGVYSVSLTVKNNVGEQQLTKSDYIKVNLLEKPFVADATRCGAGNISLSVSNVVPSTTAQWFSSAESNEIITTGNSYTTNISNSTTFYVQFTQLPQKFKVGPISNNIGEGGNFNSNDQRGLLFDLNVPITLNSVKVYSSAQAIRTIEVLDKIGGNILATKRVDIPQGESRVNLGFSLPFGKQLFMKITGPPVNLYRNTSGASFPYTVNQVISITNTDIASTVPNSYYYFYDWEITHQGCASERVPVKAIENCAANSIDHEGMLASSVFKYDQAAKMMYVTPQPNSNYAQIEIVDVLGRVKILKMIDSNAPHTLNLHFLNPNVYMFKYASDNHTENLKLFID